MTGLHVNRSTIYVEINIARRSSTFSLRRFCARSHRERVNTPRRNLSRGRAGEKCHATDFRFERDSGVSVTSRASTFAIYFRIASSIRLAKDKLVCEGEHSCGTCVRGNGWNFDLCRMLLLKYRRHGRNIRDRGTWTRRIGQQRDVRRDARRGFPRERRKTGSELGERLTAGSQDLNPSIRNGI